ncbi:MAG: 2-dehydropantoate 2-reductase [Rhodospirillales bacterium 70-18]|nr:MAG: 2-dehydropantoate 2-reductase [Rhodospirillales bacterium 70-18]
MGPILIWGAGAIGGSVGAWLKRAGHDVTFVDVVPEHVAAIAGEGADEGAGLRITGPVEQFAVTAPAFLPERVTGTWKHIFLAVKAHHTEAATRALTPHLAQDGYVLSLQNGLCETVIQRIVGRDRTMGAFVNFSADWMGPGEILFGGRGAVVLGEVTGQMTPRLAELHKVMLDFEPNAITTPEIWGYLWGKLGYGSMLFAQALGMAGIADCLARPELLPLWRALGREVNEVTLAEGVAPKGFNGFDPAAFMPNADPAAAARAVAAMVEFNRPNAKTHSGVWRDLAIRKRRTEVDVQIAPIYEIGARHGIECPTVRRLVAMIHEVENGTRALNDDNLLELLPR